MERRSFLASLAALFIARKLPAAPEVPVYFQYVPQIGDVIELRYVFGDGAFTRASVAYSINEDGAWASNAVNIVRTRMLPGIHTLAEMRSLD